MTGSESAVYLCRDFTCQQPVKDPESLSALLSGMTQSTNLRP